MMKTQPVENNTNLILQGALEKKIIDVWSQLENTGRDELEQLILAKDPANAITKLALVKLFSITSYAVIQHIIQQQSERSDKSLCDIIYELVRYCRADIIQLSNNPQMKQIQQVSLGLLNEILAHR